MYVLPRIRLCRDWATLLVAATTLLVSTHARGDLPGPPPRLVTESPANGEELVQMWDSSIRAAAAVAVVCAIILLSCGFVRLRRRRQQPRASKPGAT